MNELEKLMVEGTGTGTPVGITSSNVTVTPSDVTLAQVHGFDPANEEARHEEWHVTVEGDPLRWALFCSDFNVKALFIELSTRATQLMSAMKYNPETPGATPDTAGTFLEAAAEAGFKVIRVKHEVETLLPGEKPLYFETHLKFDGPMRWDRQGASRDLFRTTGKFDRWYMTRRARVQLFDQQGRPLPAPVPMFDVSKFIDDGPRMAKPSSFAEAESEFCLSDTNPDLDKGWL